MNTLTIATACFLNTNQELLVVRKHNTTAWMLPGGKLDKHEAPSDALIREVKEELQLILNAEALTQLGCFEAVAANEVNTRVQAHVYVATVPGNQQPAISAEIAEMKWLSLHAPFPATLAPLLKTRIIPALKAVFSTPAATKR